MYGNGETIRTKSRFCKSLLKEISFVFEGVEIAELIFWETSKAIIKFNCPTKNALQRFLLFQQKSKDRNARFGDIDCFINPFVLVDALLFQIRKGK